MQALHTLFLRTTEKMPLARAISSLMVVAAVAASDISAFSWSMCEEYCCRDSHMASCGLLEVVDGYKVREEGKNIIDLHAAPRALPQDLHGLNDVVFLTEHMLGHYKPERPHLLMRKTVISLLACCALGCQLGVHLEGHLHSSLVLPQQGVKGESLPLEGLRGAAQAQLEQVLQVTERGGWTWKVMKRIFRQVV